VDAAVLDRVGEEIDEDAGDFEATEMVADIDDASDFEAAGETDDAGVLEAATEALVEPSIAGPVTVTVGALA
jgi:hypothetical protein